MSSLQIAKIYFVFIDYFDIHTELTKKFFIKLAFVRACIKSIAQIDLLDMNR